MSTKSADVYEESLKQKVFIKAVEKLNKAFEEVDERWCELGTDKYPFEESFDEYPMRVFEWLSAIKEEVKKGE